MKILIPCKVLEQDQDSLTQGQEHPTQAHQESRGHLPSRLEQARKVFPSFRRGEVSTTKPGEKEEKTKNKKGWRKRPF